MPGHTAKRRFKCDGLDPRDSLPRDALRGKTGFVHTETVSMDIARPASGEKGDIKLCAVPKAQFWQTTLRLGRKGVQNSQLNRK